MRMTGNLLAGLAIALLTAATAIAADYPSRPVKLITQGAAGSGPDVIARVVADQLGKLWGQSVAIVNSTGGGGLLAAQSAAEAEPDGYTLYVPTITTFVILPEMHDRLPFDLDRDFARVNILAETPMVLAVASSANIATLQQLVTQAKARPNELFYAANNRGSLPHLAGEMIARRTGMPITFVPYPGVTAGLQDVLGGRVPVIVESVGALSAVIQAGSVKALAVTSPTRLPQWPDVPAVAETVPGFAAMAWIALMAPARTPAGIVGKINSDVNQILANPDVKQRLRELGATTRPMSTTEVTEFVRSEVRTWQPIVRQIGLKGQ